jgi:hypothetical protein
MSCRRNLLFLKSIPIDQWFTLSRSSRLRRFVVLYGNVSSVFRLDHVMMNDFAIASPQQPYPHVCHTK